MKAKKIIAANIRHYRTKIPNLTQQIAAEKIGCSLQAWQRWESKSDPELPQLLSLFEIAHLLKTSPSELLK